MEASTTNAPARSDRAATAALSLGAAVLITLIAVIGSGRFDRPALAEMTAKSRSYSAMTTRADNEEILYVIDDRSETLIMYRVRNARQVDMIGVESLPALFTRARAVYESTGIRGRP